jgi:hypothetical protein
MEASLVFPNQGLTKLRNLEFSVERQCTTQIKTASTAYGLRVKLLFTLLPSNQTNFKIVSRIDQRRQTQSSFLLVRLQGWVLDAVRRFLLLHLLRLPRANRHFRRSPRRCH